MANHFWWMSTNIQVSLALQVHTKLLKLTEYQEGKDKQEMCALTLQNQNWHALVKVQQVYLIIPEQEWILTWSTEASPDVFIKIVFKHNKPVCPNFAP